MYAERCRLSERTYKDMMLRQCRAEKEECTLKR